MNKKISKILSTFLAVITVFSIVPLNAIVPSPQEENNKEEAIVENIDIEDNSIIKENIIYKQKEEVITQNKETEKSFKPLSYDDSVDVVLENQEVPSVFADLQNEGWIFSSHFKADNKTGNSYTWNSKGLSNKTITYELEFERPAISETDSQNLIYNPGDITISVNSLFNKLRIVPSGIPELLYIVSTGNQGEESVWEVTEEKEKYYNLPSKFIFTNKNTINPTEAIKGKIAISYTLKSQWLDNSTEYTFMPKLTTTHGANINGTPSVFKFTSLKVPYILKTNSFPVRNNSLLPSNKDDYYWMYLETIYNPDFNKGSRESTKKELILNNLNGIKVYDKNFKELSLDGNSYVLKNNYKESISSTGLENLTNNNNFAAYYVAIPKNIYTNKINLNLEIKGIPRNEKDKVLLGEQSVYVDLTKFELDYSGKVFHIATEGKMSVNEESMNYRGSAIKETQSFGYSYDPLLGAINMDCNRGGIIGLMDEPSDTSSDMKLKGEILKDNEYWYDGFYAKYKTSKKHISTGVIDKDTKEDISSQYKAKILVRYEDELEFTQIAEGYLQEPLLNEQGYFDFKKYSNGKHVVEYTVRFENVDRNFQFGETAYIVIKAPRFNGKRPNHSLTYFLLNDLELYKAGNNEPIDLKIKEDNYISTPAKEILMKYDTEKYKKLKFRGISEVTSYEPEIPLFLAKDVNVNSIKADDKKEQLFFDYNINLQFSSAETSCGFPSRFSGFVISDLLPEGISLVSTNEEIKNTINFKDFYGVNNKYPNSKDLTSHLKDYITVETIPNYNNTERTLIRITLDTSNPDDLIDFSQVIINCPTKEPTVFEWIHRMVFKCKIDYDYLYSHGSDFTNNIYIGDNKNNKNSYSFKYFSSKYSTESICSDETDDGSIDPQFIDVNNNGDTEEQVIISELSHSFPIASGSYTGFTKQVSTDLKNFITGTGNARNNAIYAYRLKARMGETKSKDLVMFDALENAGGDTGFHGTLKGFDTSYIESKGYKAQIYYAETMDYVTDLNNPMWKVYSENTPKNKIKSIAFKFVNADGTPIIYKPNSLMYVDILLESPDNSKYYTHAKNNAHCEWVAINGNDENNIKLDSNIVTVTIPNSSDVLNTGIYTLILNKEIIGTPEDFEKMKLNPNDVYSFNIILENKEDKTLNVNVVLNSNQELVLRGLPAGTWTIKEVDDAYFDFVKFYDDNNSIISEIIVPEQLKDDVTYHVTCVNKIETNRFYEEKTSKLNMFKH